MRFCAAWACLVLSAVLIPSYAQETSYAKDLQPALAAKLKDYKPDSRFGGYALNALAKFETGAAPAAAVGEIKRHVGIAFSFDDAHCTAADKPCEPLIYPALLVHKDGRIALTVLRQRGDRWPIGETDPNSYVELFLSGSLKLGGTREFQMLFRGDVPESLFGEVKLKTDEWMLRDQSSASALRQSGTWLLAVSVDRSASQGRSLIYAFPSSFGKDEDKNFFAPTRK